MKGAEGALAELGAVLAAIDDASVDAACETIAGAGSVMLTGCGREALQLRGFAMRLFHLGIPVAMAGDVTAPPLGAGDLLIASAGPGELATVSALMRKARDAGAEVLFLTAEPQATAAALATRTLVVPAQTMARDQGAAATSTLPMGSLYEGALFLLFELMVLRLRDRLGVTPEDMRKRHTNME